MKKDSETEKYILKIAQECYRIRQIFESCKTLEHVENTNNLACFLVDKWSWFCHKYSYAYTCHYIWPMINDAAKDMERFYREARTRVINGN